MSELRRVNPASLVLNPANPRRTATPKAMDDQLAASIRAIGLIQPPKVKEIDGTLQIVVGNRRTTAAIAAGLTEIDVLVCDADEAADSMAAISENVVRVSMGSVDIWRATEALERQGWNEQAIADALALPLRTVKRLKLLALLHPPMLDIMALGSMPNEEQLRTIAAASREEQAQVWKKHKPKKGQEVSWHEVSRALSRRRIPFSAAKFGEDLAKAYGIVWEEDLFTPADEDGRYTTNVEGFFGAQQEWMTSTLPERATVLTTNDHGGHVLPKKAQIIYGKPGKSDIIGHYVDPYSGAVKTVAYRMPEPKKATKATRSDKEGSAGADDAIAAPQPKSRAPVTAKGVAMIGDLRTDALHQALKEAPIDETTLLGLLILALGARNVSVNTGGDFRHDDRRAMAETIIEGGVLSTDRDTLHQAARTILAVVLSCRENMTNSGIVARVAGDTIGADIHLPSMATSDFLSCVCKTALEAAAVEAGVVTGARAKDTRASLVNAFKDRVYVYPPARFAVSQEELAAAKQAQPRHFVPGTGWTGNEDDAEDAGGEGDDGANAAEEDPSLDQGDDDCDRFAIAAE